ncbi:MAG: hypothetical protein P4M15_05585 [Alphaproteobacteria bacterium]|nr:hypothetical protein [Alphaproteobacteria bacterium]
MPDEIKTALSTAGNFTELTEALLAMGADSFFIDQALREKHKTGLAIEAELPAVLLRKIWALAAEGAASAPAEFQATRAYGMLINLQPALVDEGLFALLCRDEPRAQTLLALTANMLSNKGVAHLRILSVNRTRFRGTFHSSMHLFDHPAGLKLMFDCVSDAPEHLADAWPKKPDAICNGINYREIIFPVALELMQRAVTIHTAEPARFATSSAALAAMENILA